MLIATIIIMALLIIDMVVTLTIDIVCDRKRVDRDDLGNYGVYSLEIGEDTFFRSRKIAVKFAKKFHGIVYDLDTDTIIANYEKEN